MAASGKTGKPTARRTASKTGGRAKRPTQEQSAQQKVHGDPLHGDPLDGEAAAAEPDANPNASANARAAQGDRPEGGLMPLDYLLSIVRDESQDRPARVDAAKAAAPYCHARLSSLDHRGGLTISHEQALEELD